MEALRKYATPLSLITGVAVSVTGLMMTFGIRGHEFGEIHEWIGFGFIAALLMHLMCNWRGLGFMFKSATSAAIAVVGGVLLAAAIFVHLPASGGHGQQRGGPWIVANRLAEAPIETSAPALGLTADDAVTKLRAAGVEVDGPNDSLAHISRDHGQPLPRLYGLLLSEG